MKKKELFKQVLCGIFFSVFLPKQFLLMFKWTIFLTVLVYFQSFANGYAQKSKVNVNFKDVKLKKALSLLEEKSDIRFLYTEKFLPDKSISLVGENIPVLEALTNILSSTNLQYREFGDGLVLIISSKGAKQQDLDVTGKVSDINGDSLPGVSVKLKGTNIGTTTNEKGAFNLKIPENGVLVFSYIGFVKKEIVVTDEAPLNVTLEDGATSLDAVVVTGYSAQRKKDIIGAVAVVKADELKSTPSPNLASQLQGRAAGVTVSTSGDPGSTAAVRIRGFSSYGNNNPLYVIDGVPTTDPSRINPEDVESLQVLKDASSASIYGARAANGVIVITTKQGSGDKTSLSYSSYVGLQVLPYNKVPSLLNTSQMMDYLNKTTDESYIDPIYGKHGAFSIPEYYIVSNAYRGGASADDPRINPDLYSIADYSNVYQIFKTSMGTDWFRAMSQKALIHNQQLELSGGSEKSAFAVGLNYINQEGTFKYTGYDRFSVRVNTSFKPLSFLTIGENLQLSYDNRKGDNGNLVGEQNAWANAYRSAPFIPVYDINGGFGGSLIGGVSGISWNPVAYLYRRKDWFNKSLRTFGNAFAEVAITKGLSFRTSFGIDASNGSFKRAYLQGYERSERRTVTQLQEGSVNFFNWTWTNTVNYEKDFGEHRIKVLAGTEAVKNSRRDISVSVNGFDIETDDFLSLNTAIPSALSDIALQNPNLGNSSLFSYFARADYTLKDRYLFNATFRRDGSSLFGENAKYANFPSFGAGWRISEESFLKDITWLSDLKLRAGWGQMGSISNVPFLNQYSTYMSTPTAAFYDVEGGNNGSTQGFVVNTVGNSNTKWETTEATNIGLDITLFDGRLSFTTDIYQKDTKDLLVPQLRNSLEPMITLPLINIGTMRNRGVDFQVNTTGKIGKELNYDLGLSFSHYKNELTKLNDENTVQLLPAGRLGNVLLTTEGEPVSSFYGYQIDGFYNTEEEVANGPTIGGSPGRVGTWRYVDYDGDGDITTADRTILGSPHPDFQVGFNLGFKYKNFDLTGFLFWNQGNELFNNNKFFTYMGVLGGNVASGKLYEAWTPETAAIAKTPKLGVGDENGYTSFVTSNSLSFYVEDGSYLRLKTLQFGFTFPNSWMERIKVSNARVYLQVQNLFTLTKYSGADPDLGLISTGQGDQALGVDLSGFPSPRQFLFGLNLSF